jgi:hypothetical protein
MIAVVVALVTWVNGFGTLFELFDRHAVTGAATGAIAVTLVYGTLPVALVYNHRFFAWTPARRADRDETVQQRVTWWLASAGVWLARARDLRRGPRRVHGQLRLARH